MSTILRRVKISQALDPEVRAAKEIFRKARIREKCFATVSELVSDATLLEQFVKDEILHEAQTGRNSIGMMTIIKDLNHQIESKTRILARLLKRED